MGYRRLSRAGWIVTRRIAGGSQEDRSEEDRSEGTNPAGCLGYTVIVSTDWDIWVRRYDPAGTELWTRNLLQTLEGWTLRFPLHPLHALTIRALPAPHGQSTEYVEYVEYVWD